MVTKIGGGGDDYVPMHGKKIPSHYRHELKLIDPIQSLESLCTLYYTAEKINE